MWPSSIRTWLVGETLIFESWQVGQFCVGLMVKAIVAEALKPDPDTALCDRLVRGCFASEDYVEGRRAFMEKRRPAFTGT